jgi:beta-N-acetylhexosaminidase
VVHHTLRQWWQIDAPPFQAAIRAGADQIMVGHISVPALDPSGLPASLSPKVVTALLRDRLGYRGVVVTDSLRMAAVLKGRSNAQVAVLAVRAGADQLLMPKSIPVAYRALLAAVRDGRISMARLDESVTRIIALKAERGVLDHPLADAAKAASHENTPADRDTAARLADRSITMVVNRSADGRRALPLKGRSVYLAGPAASALAPALRRALGRAGGRLARDPAAAQDIVVATLNAVTDPAQQRLVAQLADTGRPVVVAATGLPYDLGLFPRAAAGLAAYSESGASLTALAKALTGGLNPAGRLPVPIPGRDGKTVYPVDTCVRY